MDNLYPQFQVEVQESGKKWKTIYYDPDVDVLKGRLEYLRLTRPEGEVFRLLGLKGELIEQVEGITLRKVDKAGKSATVSE
jgi:hypothetical protein